MEMFRRVSLTGLTTAGFAAPSEKYAKCQKALNEKWPPPAIARRLQDVGRDREIDVLAWVEWERDGEQWVAGTATRWDRHHVRVTLPGDPRTMTGGLWLSPEHVRRREPGDQAAS